MSDDSISKSTASARDAAAKLAEDTAEKARDTARTKVEDARDHTADEVNRAAEAAEAAADTFDAETLQAQAIGRLADTLEDAAQQVRTTDIDKLARQVSDFARANPAVFVGGAAVLGFAATRLLKARPASRGAAARETYTAPSSRWDDEDADMPDLTSRGAV